MRIIEVVADTIYEEPLAKIANEHGEDYWPGPEKLDRRKV